MATSALGTHEDFGKYVLLYCIYTIYCQIYTVLLRTTENQLLESRLVVLKLFKQQRFESTE